MNEPRRSFYLSRTKRIAFTVAVAVIIAALFGVALYLTWLQFTAERLMLGFAGLGASMVLFALFGLSIQEAQRSITRRGYARPVESSGSFERVVKSIFKADDPTSHPVNYRRAVKRVRFDDGSVVEVDLGEFYFVLVREARFPSVLPWHRCVGKERMDKREWAAYRKVLVDAGAVEVDGRGSYTLNCHPWAAIEKIKAGQ